MTDTAQISFSFPAIRSKKVTCAFDFDAITSDSGVLLLAQAERRLGIVDRLAALIPDGRDPSRVLHSLSNILRARVLAIAAGYEDADDLDALRHDPAFMMALGNPCLRGRQRTAGRLRPVSRPDAVRQGNQGPCPQPHPAHPQSLAGHPDHSARQTKINPRDTANGRPLPDRSNDGRMPLRSRLKTDLMNNPG